MPGIRVRRRPVGENTGVARYQPRHISHEVVDPGRRRPRRSLIIGGAATGAVLVVAAVAVPLMASTGGGGGGPPKTSPAAVATTGQGAAATTATTAATGASSGTGTGVSTRAAGSAALSTTSTTATSTTTTTVRPQVNPAAKTSPAVNVAAPDGLGQVMETLWARADPGGIAISAADVGSTLSGSVFYAEQPAIGTYWAIARFVPSSQAQARSGTAAGAALLAQFNSTAVFVKVPGKEWAYLAEFTTTACGQAVPSPVLASWGMC
jgi:hypothetical protein